LADLIEIGYGSQCWKLDVTPNGNALNERRLSSALLPVPFVNNSHSCLRISSTRFGSIGTEVDGTNRNVCLWLLCVSICKTCTAKVSAFETRLRSTLPVRFSYF